MITNDRETIFFFLILFQCPQKMAFAFSFHISSANALLNVQISFFPLALLGLNLQNVKELQKTVILSNAQIHWEVLT